MARKRKELPLLEKVEITDVAAEGKAIAKVNDLVIFVPYVVPGDVVDLQNQEKKASLCRGGSGEVSPILTGKSRSVLSALRCMRRLQMAGAPLFGTDKIQAEAGNGQPYPHRKSGAPGNIADTRFRKKRSSTATSLSLLSPTSAGSRRKRSGRMWCTSR